MSAEKRKKHEADAEMGSSREGNNNNSICTINRRMIPSKFLYILYGGNLGSQVAFLNIFFQSVGLSKSQAGMITGIRFIASTICQPIWGTIADYTGRRKLVLTILCIGSAFPLFSLPWVSEWIYTPSKFAACTGNETINLINATRHDVFLQCQVDREKALSSLYYALLSLVTFTSIFLIPLPGYIEAIVMEVVKSADDGAQYGTQRIFGSLGFSLANFLAGLAAQHYNVQDMSQYTAVFFLYLPYTLMIIPVGSYLINQASYESATEANNEELKEKSTVGGLVRDVFVILQKTETIVFMGTVFFTGLANNFFLNFSYPYVKDEMHRTETEMTLVVTVATVAEASIFPFTTKIIHLVGGNTSACIIGLFSYFIRFLVMALELNFGLLVAIQTLHCLGFALAFHAILEKTHAMSPPHLVMTMNSIVMMLFFSVSNVVANVLGGYLAEHNPIRLLFLWMSYIFGAWFTLLVLYYGGHKLKKKLLHKLFGSTPSVSYEAKRDGNHALAFENPINCVSEECDSKTKL